MRYAVTIGMFTFLLVACGDDGPTGHDSGEEPDDAGVTVDALPGDATAIDAASLDASVDGAVTPALVELESFAPALLVLGQPDFTTPAQVNGGPVAIVFPYGRGSWHDGVLYLPSSELNRVLGWRGFPARNGEPADFVLGQPDFDTIDLGLSASAMEFPETVIADGGRLFVLDYGGSRVMAWDEAPTTTGVPADHAIGQADLDTRENGCTQALNDHPDDFFVGAGHVLVADRENHRVLIWNSVPTASGVAPDLVLGQQDFTHCTANDADQDDVADPTPSAGTLSQPVGVWTDGTRVVVADSSNHRILIWNEFPTDSGVPADLVLGQAGFTSADPDTTAGKFAFTGAVDSNGIQLAVGDAGNRRVLLWNTFPTTSGAPPDVVLGQADFTHGAANDDDQDGTDDGAPTARTLGGYAAPFFVGAMLLVLDLENNRALVFGELPCPSGAYEPADAPGTCADDPCQPDPCGEGAFCRNDSGEAACD